MTQTKIQGKFYPLTSEVTTILRQAKLTAAEWRIWSYLIEVDPWGDRYQDLDSLDVMSKCDCSRATFYRAIAKFQKLGLFDIQDKGFSIRNLTGASKLTSADEKIGDKKLRKGNLKNETKVVSKMRLDSQICENDLKNETGFSKMRLDSQICENQSPKPLPDIAFKSPQTLQTYSDFKKTLSESERENFLKFVEKKIENLEKPINDLEAWLASKNAANQNRWEVYHERFKIEGQDNLALQEKLAAQQRASANFQNRHNLKNQENRREALEKAERQRRAIANFKKHINRDLPIDNNEPENTNSEEERQKRAAFDELLSSSLGEKEESLAQRRRKAIAEAKQQRQELAHQRREAAVRYSEQQEPELQQRRERMLREIEEFNLRQKRKNTEI